MYFRKISLLIVVLVVSFNPYMSWAGEHSKYWDEEFEKTCLNIWMKRSDKSLNKTSFKNFSEKACDCIANQSLLTKEAIQQAVRICMSQTMLRDAMDNIESDQELNKLSLESIKIGCGNEWALIYPDMYTATKKGSVEYCSCAATKLLELSKNRDNLADTEWYRQIDIVADECSRIIIPDEATVAVKKHVP